MPTSGKPPDLHVLARGETWVVVAKPPGLLVHRTHLAKAEHFAVQILRNQLGQRVDPIHRIDRSASGCLLFSLDPSYTPILQAALADADATKTYLALVRGRWNHEGIVDIEAPMKDDNKVLRDARTLFEGLGASAEPRCSLVRAQPKTGRYHQVRRHLVRLSHPILHDTTHGDSRQNRYWREHWGLSRLALHCASLDLPLPDGSRLQAKSPLFSDLFDLFAQMPWWTAAQQVEDILTLSPLPLGD